MKKLVYIVFLITPIMQAMNHRPLSPGRPLAYDEHRTEEKMEMQRDLMHQPFEGGIWSDLFHKDFDRFMSLFPNVYFEKYGEYPPLYYDYYDEYGDYPQNT